MKKTVILIICVCLELLYGKSVGQSYHFSQFFSTPLLLNPANTGYTDGFFRGASNFRSQWTLGGEPYMTGALSADFSILRDRIPEGNRLGLGILLVNDKSLQGALQNNTVAISMAYNIVLNADAGTHTFGAGLQGVIQQRRIDMTKLSFENQFGGNGFSTSIPAEAIPNNLDQYFDASLGLQYHYSGELSALFVSTSGYNILQQNQAIQVSNYRLPVRYNFIANYHRYIGEDGNLYSSINFMKMGNANTKTIGFAFGKNLGIENNQEVKLGLWYRFKDAMIPYLGYQVNGLQFGFSFDYTVSELRTTGTSRNAFELSFIYKSPDNSDLRKYIPWY